MGCKNVCIGDVATYRKDSIKPVAGVTYRCYSLPAFDNCRSPEILDGSEILSSKLKIEKGDILVNKLNMRFKRIWPLNELDDNSVCSTEFLPLHPKESVDSVFLLYTLLSDSFTKELSGMRTGTSGSHQRVKPEWVLGYRFDLPDLDCQRKIGIVLAAIDLKIACNAKINGYLLELATIRFEQELANGESVFKFSELVELEDSKRVPLNSRDRETRKGPYPYYGATSIMDYVDDYLFDGVRVLLGEDGTVIREDGRPVLQYVWGKYWVNNHAHILKSKSAYSLEAIYIALARTTISHIVTGAVQMKISQKNLNNLELEMPALNDLSYLEDIFTLYRSNIEESKKLANIRDSLLPKLMSGEIDVSKIDLKQLNSHLSDY